MNLNKINELIESLPKREDKSGNKFGNEFHASCDISGSVAIYKIIFEKFTFEVEKEGYYFLILSRSDRSIIGFKQFTNGEDFESEIIKEIKSILDHQRVL